MLLSLRSKVRRLHNEPNDDGSSLRQLAVDEMWWEKHIQYYLFIFDLPFMNKKAVNTIPFKLSVCRSRRFPMDSGKTVKRFFSTFRIWQKKTRSWPATIHTTFLCRGRVFFTCSATRFPMFSGSEVSLFSCRSKTFWNKIFCYVYFIYLSPDTSRMWNICFVRDCMWFCIAA